MAAASVGVGAGLLVMQGVRKAKAARGGSTRAKRGLKAQAADAAASPLRDAASERGRTAGREAWHEHPLTLATAAVAAGLALGLLLPATRREDALLGGVSDRFAGNAKRAAGELLDQGIDLLARAVSEGVSALTESTEQAGLTPERLGGKLRRVAADVREAVTDAVKA